MARRFHCPRPVNRLVMMRTRGLVGPFFQNVGGACIHSVGNSFAPGGALAGVKAISGAVSVSDTVRIRFSSCVNVGSLAGIGVSVNSGPTVSAAGVTSVDDVLKDFTFAVTINPGDDVLWVYDGTGITDCDTGAPIPSPQSVAAVNNLPFADDYIQLEVGGEEYVLLETGSPVETEE